MREIKFRQWISKYRQMEYGAGMVSPGHWQGFSDICFEYNPIMQFTGLLDSQGKEIYEGDICFCDDDNIYTGVIMERTVNWNNNKSRFDLAGKSFEFYASVEVIGNIYENGNLLKTTPSSKPDNRQIG